MVTNMERVTAVVDLCRRAGCQQFDLSWSCPHTPDEDPDHNCEGVRWVASVRWKGTRLFREAGSAPGACDALAGAIIEGGACRCGATSSLVPGAGKCVWAYLGGRWLPGCNVDPVRMPREAFADLRAMGKALNREQRRRRRK